MYIASECDRVSSPIVKFIIMAQFPNIDPALFSSRFSRMPLFQSNSQPSDLVESMDYLTLLSGVNSNQQTPLSLSSTLQNQHNIASPISNASPIHLSPSETSSITNSQTSTLRAVSVANGRYRLAPSPSSPHALHIAGVNHFDFEWLREQIESGPEAEAESVQAYIQPRRPFNSQNTSTYSQIQCNL